MKQRLAYLKASTACAALTVCLISVGGCHSPWSAGHMAQSQNVLPDTTLTSAEAPSEEPNANPALATQEAAMVAVLDQLQEIEAIDPAAKQELLADLKEAKPENWPLIVQQFQSALAYRQQLAEKETPAAQAAVEQVAQQAQQKTPTPPRVPEPKAVEVAITPQAKPMAVAVDLSTPPEPTVSSPRSQQQTLAPVPSPSVAEQVSFVTQVQSAESWQDHLQQTIVALEEATQSPPRTTEEVQQHMRLRLLRQLAGQEEQALAPIVGAPPAMQDYWAKQMFTIATFLDSSRQPDDKRRAAGSLVHLDQARAKLSELATLQIRNLTFVKSVDGYGEYEPRVETQFRPGQQVSLYSEIENFQSTSTKTGYRTLLATSYEVVDLNGQRVDGRNFPEVEDFCQNVRRDFHMQYGIDLPTRIYPGKYELRLVVTDRQSHKIGQASVPFEIVE